MGKKKDSNDSSNLMVRILISCGIGFGVLLVIFIIFLIVVGVVKNNRGATEARAVAGANKFVTENNIPAQRVSCAGDSNHDGYGSCAVTTETGRRIKLSCPTDYWDVEFWGASNCKEEFMDVNSTGTTTTTTTSSSFSSTVNGKEVKLTPEDLQQVEQLKAQGAHDKVPEFMLKKMKQQQQQNAAPNE